MKIACEVINDLLPLYVDDVLSDASRELVDEHIFECAECRNTLENMKGTIELPVNKEIRINETKALKGLKKLVSSWKLRTAVISLFSIAAILVLGTLYMTSKTIAIPYDGSNLTVQKQKNGFYLDYNGRGSIIYSAANVQDGEWKISITQSLWDKYIKSFYDGLSNRIWFCEPGAITKLVSSDGDIIWEGSEEDREAYAEWRKRGNREGTLERAWNGWDCSVEYEGNSDGEYSITQTDTTIYPYPKSKKLVFGNRNEFDIDVIITSNEGEMTTIPIRELSTGEYAIVKDETYTVGVHADVPSGTCIVIFAIEE